MTVPLLLNLPDDARERLRELAVDQDIDIETLIERWIWEKPLAVIPSTQ
jgi:hypothetical protein